MFPQLIYRDPYLCTYYVFMALLVVSLTIRLLWFPSVELVTELNTVITRVVIYFNTEVLGYSNIDFFTSLEEAFLSEKTLLSITLMCTSYVLYLASNDIISYASCYFAFLPTFETLEKVKKFVKFITEDIINLIGSRKGSKSRIENYGQSNTPKQSKISIMSTNIKHYFK